MAEFRTLVIAHTDALGKAYCTRVITDFPPEQTADYIRHATDLYQRLGMGVVSVVEVEETHHERLVGGMAPPGPTGIKRLTMGLGILRPQVALAAMFVMVAGTFGLALYGNLHLDKQDMVTKAVAYQVGVPKRQLQLLDDPVLGVTPVEHR